MSRYPFNPDYAVPPGHSLNETLKYLKMSLADCAEMSGLPTKRLSGLLKGTLRITPEIAGRLENATGIPARMWNKLETNYREQLAKKEPPNEAN